ncbi:hypothetical protein DW886_03590 [Enterocloster aldenensis]|uniref:hypothetical protein n=1 Tax=Enterocloster aldenensis TaxID=358742 RepID=UPI000E5092F7|nr:hypothetical protein DW886_03590 [Enterocloster aldenensis]
MERYDFTVNADLAGNVPEELDRLTNKEMIAVHEAIQQIKQNTETEATTKHMEWFDTAILPVLKEYAEQTSSILDIERDREMLIQATLRNACGLDISSDSHCLYMVIMSTVHLSVDVENGDPVLVLTYDLKEF